MTELEYGLRAGEQGIQLPPKPEEPEYDDSTPCCLDCEQPNQFGEVCETCQREREEERLPALLPDEEVQPTGLTKPIELTFRSGSLRCPKETYQNAEWATKLIAMELTSDQLKSLVQWFHWAEATAKELWNERETNRIGQEAEAYRATAPKFGRPVKRGPKPKDDVSLDDLAKEMGL